MSSPDREACLLAIRRLLHAAARAEPVLVRSCGPVNGELGLGPEAVRDALRRRADVLKDMPQVLGLHAASLRVVLAFRSYVDFSGLELPPFAAAAVQLFLDEVKAGRVPTAERGRVRARTL